MHGFAMHGIYVFLVALERWSEFQGNRDTVQRTPRMRRERGNNAFDQFFFIKNSHAS